MTLLVWYISNRKRIKEIRNISKLYSILEKLLNKVTRLPPPDNIGYKSSQGIMRLRKFNKQNVLHLGCNTKLLLHGND